MLSPDYPSALYFLARIAEQHARNNEAIALLERATASSGRTAKYLHALSMVDAEAGRKNEAHKLLDELRQQAKRQYVDPNYITSLEAKIADSGHQ